MSGELPDGWARCNPSEYHSKSSAYADGYRKGWSAAHFEEEQKLAAAEAKIQRALAMTQSWSVPLGVTEARHYDRLLVEVRRILTEGSEK